MSAARDELTMRLLDAAARVAERRRLVAELKAIDVDLAVRRANDERWRREAERAAEQLQWVRGWSLRAVLLRWRGLADELGATAAAAIDEARREQAACELAMEPVLAARDKLAALCAQLDGAEREHEELLGAKEAWLREQRHPVAAQLDELRARLDTVTAGARSIVAAASHARDALAALREAREALSRSRPGGAKVWWLGGTWGLLAASARGRAAAGAMARAASRFGELEQAVSRLRAAGIAAVAMPQLATATAASADAPESRQHLTRLIEETQQVTWSLERAAEAAHAAQQHLRAERVACIEGAP